MNAAMKICQAAYDAQLPPPVSTTPQENARADWLYDSAECLIRGGDVKFQRRMHSPQRVSAEEFALAVDEFVNNRLAECQVHTAALGWLVITTAIGRGEKVYATELLGYSDHPLGKLGEIAEAMLLPLVDDALIAIAEDNDL